MEKFVEIDGSFLEGGGQILRNALSLSCILRRPIRVTKIRANRPNPGLSNQHLYVVDLLQKITGARVRGNEIKSTQIEFDPGVIKSGEYAANTGTAASVSLVLQATLPVLLYGSANSELDLIGGTNVGMAPQVDFMTEVFRPNLEMFGATFDFDLMRRGYYPRGGGRCKVALSPVRCLKAADLTSFGKLTEIVGWCFVAGRLPLRVANEMQSAVERELQALGHSNLNIESYKEGADVAKDNGSGVVLKATTQEGRVVGAASLGEKQVNGQELGVKAAKELLDYIRNGTCVDCHVQDQLIIFMALAQGNSRIHTCSLTNHTRTAIHVVESMTGAKFQVQNVGHEHVIISCEGIGFQNTHL